MKLFSKILCLFFVAFFAFSGVAEIYAKENIDPPISVNPYQGGGSGSGGSKKIAPIPPKPKKWDNLEWHLNASTPYIVVRLNSSSKKTIYFEDKGGYYYAGGIPKGTRLVVPAGYTIHVNPAHTKGVDVDGTFDDPDDPKIKRAQYTEGERVEYTLTSGMSLFRN